MLIYASLCTFPSDVGRPGMTIPSVMGLGLLTPEFRSSALMRKFPETIKIQPGGVKAELVVVCGGSPLEQIFFIFQELGSERKSETFPAFFKATFQRIFSGYDHSRTRPC